MTFADLKNLGCQILIVSKIVYKAFVIILKYYIWVARKDDLPSKRNIGGFDLPNPTEDYPINYVLD